MPTARAAHQGETLTMTLATINAAQIGHISEADAVFLMPGETIEVITGLGQVVGTLHKEDVSRIGHRRVYRAELESVDQESNTVSISVEVRTSGPWGYALVSPGA